MATASKKPAAKKATSDNQVKLVKDLADILDGAGLAELEYETETVAIRLSRASSGAPAAAFQPVTPATANLAPPVGPATEVPAQPADHPGAVTSPMVGTVYTAPEPGTAAYISEGDSVSQGQTLLIVEAMKVMNPITAPKAGTVVKIFVQNAQPVEFGETLVIVE